MYFTDELGRDMGVNFGLLGAAVAQDLLDDAQVSALFE